MKQFRFSGGCNCGEVRYRLLRDPLFVHACHCIKCQKNASSVFGMTTIILEQDFQLDSGNLVAEAIPDAPHRIRRFCTSCKDHIFTTATNHPATALLKTGSLVLLCIK
ncbi:GFA family protein [Chloroflexi bacterium TSY]|nr:GFA family protein [Chloroflexi bacterium TSY]